MARGSNGKESSVRGSRSAASSADNILYGRRPKLPGRQDELQQAETTKNTKRLRDKIEAGESAHKYWAPCEQCGADMGVNMYGMGRCPECGYNRNPLKS